MRLATPGLGLKLLTVVCFSSTRRGSPFGHSSAVFSSNIARSMTFFEVRAARTRAM